jgi:hypothetical protein
MTALQPYKHSEQKYCTPECHDQLEICYEYSQIIGGEYPANKLANKVVKVGTWKQEVVAVLVARCCYCFTSLRPVCLHPLTRRTISKQAGLRQVRQRMWSFMYRRSYSTSGSKAIEAWSSSPCMPRYTIHCDSLQTNPHVFTMWSLELRRHCTSILTFHFSDSCYIKNSYRKRLGML